MTILDWFQWQLLPLTIFARGSYWLIMQLYCSLFRLARYCVVLHIDNIAALKWIIFLSTTNIN